MTTVDEAREALLPCPFCGGSAYHDRVERDGYEAFPDDPDRWSHVVRCRSCAAASGWSKSGPEGAARWWNMRTEAAVRAEREGWTEERLAKAIHAGCEAEWDRKASRDPEWVGTMHAKDAHRDHARAILAAMEADR